MPPATLLDKIWASHAILTRPDGATLLHIDRHLVHDGSANAFRMLKERGLPVRRPDRTFATPDHYVPTVSHDLAAMPEAHRRAMVEDLAANAEASGVTLFGLADPRQGIVHVVGPEQGLSQPGLVMVCGDSHTATHGALGALAFGVGASEVHHVLATQTLWQIKPEEFSRHRGWYAGARRVRQGRDPRYHRQNRRRRRRRACDRICGLRRSARSASRGGSPSATCRSKPVPAPAWWRRTTQPSHICTAGPMRPRAPTGTGRSVRGGCSPPMPERTSIARSGSMRRRSPRW